MAQIINGIATNAKATNPNGELKQIDGCELIIPGTGLLNTTTPGKFVFTSLPDMSDQKGVTYNDEAIPGRSLPVKTFGQGENRTIPISTNLYILQPGDEETNLRIVRAIQSAVYPRESANAQPYYPPPVCKLKCGKLFSKNYLCVVMKDYNIKFPTDVPWHQSNMCPYRIEISMSFDVVYASSKLPNQEDIIIDL